MKDRLKFLCALLAVGAFGLAGASAEIIVGFDPVTSTMPVGVGNTVTVDIVADIPAGEPVLVWGLDLAVSDPAEVSWSLVGIGPSWYGAETPDDDDLGGLAFDTGISGDGVLLATIQFTSLVPVVDTTLLLSDDYPTDLTEGFALDPSGFATVNYCCGYIVPEPASLSLLVLCGLVALRRR